MNPPRQLTIGLIGYGFMGKAHSNAWRQAPHFFDLPALRMKTICGRNARAVAAAAERFGWERSETEWRAVIEDPEIEIIDINTPNDSHAAIAIAAAEAGKAVLCEKPLARTVAEAEGMVAAVRKAHVPNMVCHNYRRVPALALAREMIDRGELGRRIYHFRARYAQDWIANLNFPLVWRLRGNEAGSGSLGDIGSHIIDLARWLVGDFLSVCAAQETFIKRRPLKKDTRRTGQVTVDDAVCVIARLRNGALATLEATRFAPGRKNELTIEINGSAGSLVFDLEKMNRLQFYSTADPENRRGFREIIATEPGHPYIESWWPPGHLIGYEHSFIHTVADFVRAIVARKTASPDFAEALASQRVLEAIAQADREKKWVRLQRA